MDLMIASKGMTPCGTSCPYYESKGEVSCIGGPKQSHCRLIMQPYWFDCNTYDVRTLVKITVSDEQWATMQRAIGRKAKSVRKPWKREHKETIHVGEAQKYRTKKQHQ